MRKDARLDERGLPTHFCFNVALNLNSLNVSEVQAVQSGNPDFEFLHSFYRPQSLPSELVILLAAPDRNMRIARRLALRLPEKLLPASNLWIHEPVVCNLVLGTDDRRGRLAGPRELIDAPDLDGALENTRYGIKVRNICVLER